jgi:hypothetical protein
MLTENEQAYWQSFNLWPHEADRFGEEGAERNRRPSYSVDVLFKQRLERFQTDYFRANGADLIRRPEAGDEYTLEALHVPLTDGQFEFDQQMFLLSKAIVDSLSEPELERMSNLLTQGTLSVPKATGEGRTIQKIEHLLSLAQVQDPRTETEVLRTIQGLRSASSAHRKGKHYLELVGSLNIKERGFKVVFATLLEDCLRLLAVLEDTFVRRR